MRIAVRLPLLILGCSMAAAAVVGFGSCYTASRELQRVAEAQLVGVRESRHTILASYLEAIEQDLRSKR